MLNVIDQRIRRAFSDAALQYDVLTSMHKEIGRELVAKINQIEDADAILDIGMGTGWLTNRLTFFFPDAQVVGIDFASGMIDFARKKYDQIAIAQADAHTLPFKKESFDVAVSNLAYQWMNDLPEAFQSAYDCLKKDGQFRFTMFGKNTLNELFEAIEKNSDTSLSRLPDHKSVEESLIKIGFTDVKSDYEIIKVHFPNMMDLIRWVKDIGANALNSDLFLGKELFERANQHYEEHYKDRLGIQATFEVLWLEARK